MHYRTIFVSDLHLGSKACKAEIFLDFLKNNTCEELYLIGDIVDFIAISRRWYWPGSHNTVIQKILRIARKGTVVHYILGNHDDFFRSWIEESNEMHFGGIHITDQIIYESICQGRFLIIHGDKFDGAIRSMPWLYWLGDMAYSFSLNLNHFYNMFRKLFGLQYWSLSAYLKSKVKKAVQHVNNYEQLVALHTRDLNVDGIICGHIHSPSMKMIDNLHYINTGDWQESCSALVETIDGRLKLIYWDVAADEKPSEECQLLGILNN
jgi:UDP-2,3-diacylglucosamine pyrophosphatase LpxH